MSAPTLRRQLAKWDLTAIGVIQVIGSAIFFLPSQLAAQIGAWSPVAFLAMDSPRFRDAMNGALLTKVGWSYAAIAGCATIPA